MSQDKPNTHRQPLGCVVVLKRTYFSNHIEECIVFCRDRDTSATPFRCFEAYIGVHPFQPHKVDTEVLAYYPDQHPEDIEAHYAHSRTTGVTLFPYPYDNTPERH